VELNLLANGGSKLEDGEYFYRVTPLASYREVAATAEPYLIKGRFPPGETTLSIESGTYVFLEIQGSALVAGARRFAQTQLLLFGDSPSPPPFSSNAKDPRWPAYDFRGTGEIFWPQVGQDFILIPRAPTELAGPIQVWEREAPALGERREEGAGIAFTPATDKKLASQSGRANKPLFFVAPLKGGGSLSYSIYVHRNRYAGENLPLGLLVFSGALAATAVPVGLALKKKGAKRHEA
jgi:hypothetical protein